MWRHASAGVAVTMRGGMEHALDYASMAAARPRSLWRLPLWLVYYAGWAGGCAVLGIVGAVALYETLKPASVKDDVAVTVGPMIGAAVGALFAVLVRRRRWPQVILVVVGAVAAVPLAKTAWTIYGGRWPLGWDALALLIYCVLLAGAVCFLLSGVAGLLLNRRAGR
jgi:hypothetical protein